MDMDENLLEGADGFGNRYPQQNQGRSSGQGKYFLYTVSNTIINTRT